MQSSITPAWHLTARLSSKAQRRLQSTKAKRLTLAKSKRVTFPSQFVATGVHCGIKKDPSKLDLALILSTSPYPTSAAACFTKNAFQAAPVQVSKEVLQHNHVRSVVVSSGCANAVTGVRGMEDAWAMSQTVDDLFRRKGENSTPSTMVMSTGVIGQYLPIQRITSGIVSACKPTLTSSFESWEAAARAFMTTDTFPKLRTKQVHLPGRQQPINFVGIDKGAGMIAPRMGPPHATLLGLIATDATVEPTALQNALTYAIDRSFNAISVDGDESTNDTIIALANGAAWQGKQAITEEDSAYGAFRQALTDFAIELSSLIVWDGEGATKFVTLKVEECPTYESARQIAASLSRSMLLKCAINGADANWGRVLCAVGYSNPTGFQIVPETVSVSFVDKETGQELKLLVDGEPKRNIDESWAKALLEREDIEIKVRMGQGSEKATSYTCDLSKEYVSINGDYRS